MSTLEAFWLGIVQGLTEFLPVSSSGHLVVFQTLLGTADDGGLLFEIALHVATLGAIALFYHRRLGELVVGALRGDPAAWRYVAKLGVGTLPAVAVGLFAKDWVEASFAAPAVAGGGLLATGVIVWSTRATVDRAQGEEPGFGAAFLIGLAQALAILPGVSRSGTTVAAALALGIRADRAAEFSFLLGIVAITGAAVLMAPELGSVSATTLGAMGIGSAAALVTGLAAIWAFIRLLRHKLFHWFAAYAWVVGAAFLGWLHFTGAL